MNNQIQWVIKPFHELKLEELYGIVRSRFEVFVMEQKITCENDFDNIDQLCHHLFAYEEGQVVAYSRVIPKDISYETASIGRVLVLPQARRRGLAQEMMKKAMDTIVEDWGDEVITLSAQEYIVPLYESVGFKAVSDVYDDAGIPHIKMKYRRSQGEA